MGFMWLEFSNVNFYTFLPAMLISHGAGPGMPEVAEGKGCDLLSKGHIFKKRAETKMKGHLPTYNLI
jgi:hypothetical protein